MKIRDIEKALDILSKEDEESKILRVFAGNCPSNLGLKEVSCYLGDLTGCFKCWRKSFDLEENQDKLDKEIDI